MVIGQRLVRRLCQDKERYFLTKVELERLDQHVDLKRLLEDLKKENVIHKDDDWDKVPFYRSKKSAECPDGFAGRIGIHEVLKMTPTIKELVMKGATSAQIESQARKEGMLTMLEDGVFKAVQGLTTIEEVLRVVSE